MSFDVTVKFRASTVRGYEFMLPELALLRFPRPPVRGARFPFKGFEWELVENLGDVWTAERVEPQAEKT
jgi:hypothetical protein